MSYEYKARERASYLRHPVYGGRSLRELERGSGINRAIWSMILRGKKKVGVEMAERMASFLGVGLEDFLRVVRGR